MAQAAARPAPDKPKKEGFLSKRISFVLSVLLWLLGALFFNIIIELVGIFIDYWELPGAAHSSYLLKQELYWINQSFHDVLGSPVETSVRFSQIIYQALFVWFGFDMAQTALQTDYLAPIFDYLKATITMIQLFSVRLIIILFSLPVFFIFTLVAFTDGLMIRDLRRFGGDRESGYKWHYFIKSIKPMFVGPFVVYLASPWSIHPNWAIFPFVFSVGIAVWVSTAQFKKYM